MSWRLRPRSEHGSDDQRPTKRREVGADEDADAVGLREMMANLQRLSLYQQQTLRQLCSSVWTTWKIDSSSVAAVDGREAAQSYHSQVMKVRKGHGLGSPHIHIAMAVLEGCSKMALQGGLTTEHYYLSRICTYLEAQGPMKIDELVPFLRLKDLSGGGKSKGGKGKGGKKAAAAAGSQDAEAMDTRDMEDPAHVTLLMYQLNPLADITVLGDGVPLQAVDRVRLLHRYIENVFKHYKGEKGSGMAPPMAIERLVQRDLTTLSR